MIGFLSLFVGITSTLEIFKYKVAGVSIYPSDFFFYLLIVVLFFNLRITDFKNIKLKFITSESKYMFILYILYMLSTINIVSPVYDNAYSGYIKDSIVYTIKVSLYFIFIILFFLSSYDKQLVFMKKYVKGFFISILLHAVYSLVVLFYWYTEFYDLHTDLFYSLGFTEEDIGHSFSNFVIYPVMRVSGFHWDPAFFGLWGVIGFWMTLIFIKNIWLKVSILIIILVSWVNTVSKTGFLTFIIIFIALALIWLVKREVLTNLCSKQNKFIILSFLSILLLITTTISVLYFQYNEKYPYIYNAVNSQMLGHEGNMRHIGYPKAIVEASLVDPYHFLCGYGSRNSGRTFKYAQIKLPGFELLMDNVVFDIETDMFKILANSGIIAFMFYLFYNFYVIVIIIIKSNSHSNKYLVLNIIIISSTFFAGIFYCYSNSRWLWFFYLINIVLINNISFSAKKTLFMKE